jgi:transposase InsO family protein
MPNHDDPYRVEADSSEGALGAILSQKQDEHWKPIAYISKALTETERNYEIYDKELYAIIFALAQWRHYLMAANHVVEILTDHQNLTYFRQPQKLNRRQARWVTELSLYDFTLVHRPGRLNTQADLLSRRADYNMGEDDNKNVTVLKEDWFRALTTDEDGFLPRIRKHIRNTDASVEEALREHHKDWTREDGLILYQGRVYVPRDAALREDIIVAHHDSPIAGHPGRYKTHELITRDYWWPRVTHDTRKYVDGCETCQRTKPNRQSPRTALHPHDVPSRPWEVISYDLIVGLPVSAGFDTILVIVDTFTKACKFIPTNDTITSQGFARFTIDHVFRNHGLPQKVISDRGSQFVSNFMKEVYRKLGVRMNPSTAYHPQTDGQTERINQELELYLRIFTNHRQTDWADLLSLAEFCYNDREHSSTGHSPFYLNTGQHPFKGTNYPRSGRTPAATEFVDRLRRIQEDAQAALRSSKTVMAKYYDAGKRPVINFTAGDQVYLDAKNLKTDRPTPKLDDRRHGPFRIKEKIGSSAYRLVLPKTWKRVHPVFHESLLTPYKAPSYPSQRRPPPPPPIVVGDHEEYVVDHIVDSRLRRGKLEYLVHWKDYPREDRTWEPPANVTHAKASIGSFHRLHPEAPGPADMRALTFFPYENFTTPPHPPPSLLNWENGRLDRDAQYRSRGRSP